MLRCLLGPASPHFAQERYSPPAQHRLFDTEGSQSITVPIDAGWDALARQFPSDWKPACLVLWLSYNSIPPKLWDALNRRSSTKQDSFGTLLTNTYDVASNPLVLQDSFGGLTTRLYDVLNRPVTMSYSGQSAALREDYSYTVRDQVAGQTRVQQRCRHHDHWLFNIHL